ncbi:MAG: YggT family protein [Bacillota bacterium]
MQSILAIVNVLGSAVNLMLLLRAILSWFPATEASDLPPVVFVKRVTEPMLAPIRRTIPALWGLDMSPVLAIFFVTLLVRLVRGILLGG